MKSFKLTPVIMIVLILIVLAISIYMKNSYFVEGVENMFNDKGQFSDFILPEYSQTSPLTQLTETIFYDKKNGNIVEAVVEWTTSPQSETETQSNDDLTIDVINEETADIVGENIANTIKSIASESENASKQEIKEKIQTKIDEAKPMLDMLGTKVNSFEQNKEQIIDDIADKIKTDGPNLPDNVVNNIPSIKNALSSASDVADVVEEKLSGEQNPNMEGYENTGSQPTLKRLIITPRNGSESYIYDITKTAECVKKPTQESLIDKIDSSYTTWSYVSQSEFAPETTVFYMPWKNDTYLAVYEKSDGNMNPRGVFYFSNGNTGTAEIKKVELSNYVNTQDDNNNKYVKDTKYGEYDLYQLDKFILYDIPTSNLIVRKEHNTGSINIFNGAGEQIKSTGVKEVYDTNKIHENQEKYSELKAWTTLDGQGEGIVLYIKNVDKTLVSVYGFESSTMDSLVLKNVKRFTLYGVDTGDKIEKPTVSVCDKKTAAEVVSVDNAVSVAEKPKVEEAKSDDYILKTKIVPPVCPSCPMCPDKVTCTNCGGNGGSGTVGTDGKSMVKDEKVVTKTRVIDQAGNIISETVGEVTDLARDTASGAVGLAKESVGGAVGLAKETVGGTVGLAKETVGGTVGLAKDIFGGVTGMLRDAGSGAMNVLPSGRGIPNQSIQQSRVQSANYGTDNYYTRYGMLSNKESNFVPRTANFSNFA
jgi:hypothetical protein